MKIICISDTHDHHREMTVPDGDILIHAGDFASKRQFDIKDTLDFNQWLGTLPHKHKIVIAGNHDFLFEKQPNIAKSILTNAIYLENSGITLEGLNFWGYPYTPAFDNWAFNAMTDELIDYTNAIPSEIDVLVSHGPPLCILDLSEGENLGCQFLRNRVSKLQLKLHVFGHIHPSFGQEGISINAAQCDNENNLVNTPIVVEI